MLQPNEIVKLIKFCKTKEDYSRIKFLINCGEIAVDARLALGNNPLHVAAIPFPLGHLPHLYQICLLFHNVLENSLINNRTQIIYSGAK